MTENELKERLQKTIADRIDCLCGRDNSPYPSQEALAKAIGTTRQAITNYANGKTKPSLTTIYNIAKSCNVSADWLLGLSEDHNPCPSAVDDLGISLDAVENIQEINKMGKGCLKSVDVNCSFIVDDFLSSSDFADAVYVAGCGLAYKAQEYAYKVQEDGEPSNEFSMSSLFFTRAGQAAMRFFDKYYSDLTREELEEYIAPDTIDMVLSRERSRMFELGQAAWDKIFSSFRDKKSGDDINGND